MSQGNSASKSIHTPRTSTFDHVTIKRSIYILCDCKKVKWKEMFSTFITNMTLKSVACVCIQPLLLWYP